MFASEPPIFDNSLTNISISRWSPYTYLLPYITEPDGQNFTVQLSGSTPSWIELINNSTLRISPLKQQTNQIETIPVEIVLTDETNAFSKYVVNVTLQSYFGPQYGIIETISSNDLIKGVVINATSSNIINIVDWDSNLTLPWLYFNTSYSMLILKSQMPVNMNWCKLWSTDLWGTYMCSNEFNITQQSDIVMPPVITNLFGPLTIYVNQEFIFKVPSDLFYSADDSLDYSISVPYWNRNYPLESKLAKHNKTEQYYLYLSSNSVQIWYLSLSATDIYNQTALATIEVKINAWASKDCLKCSGSLQSDWNVCLSNYYKLNK